MNRGNSQLTGQSPIGKYPPGGFHRLCGLLNVGEAWKKLAWVVPNRDHTALRFSTDDMNQFELARDPTKALLNAWATDAVTLNDLIEVLDAAEYFREADLVRKLLPALEEHESTCQSSGLWVDAYETIAVKRLRRQSHEHPALNLDSDSQFLNELRVLSGLPVHNNLIKFLGWSSDGPALCIVCEYLPGGSLQDRLAAQLGGCALTAQQRIRIAQDTARAITHLHALNLIHRDVKSANILLTDEARAKLGDYGIARVGPHDGVETQTQRIVGTTAYMPLEYIRDGELSYLTDAYSLGVVLLELLTGLRPLDCQRQERNLVSHIEENCPDIHAVVDPRAGPWDGRSVDAVNHLSQRLLSQKSTRPLVSAVLPEIEAWDVDLPSTY